jgi:hypothetical protein
MWWGLEDCAESAGLCRTVQDVQNMLDSAGICRTMQDVQNMLDCAGMYRIAQECAGLSRNVQNEELQHLFCSPDILKRYN